MNKAFLSILVSLAVGSEGVYKYDGLRAKFSISTEKIDSEYFFDIPRTICDVEKKGWRLTERPEGSIRELKMYCSPGWLLCPLYTNAGFVAGIQLAVPVDAVDSTLKPEQKFIKWTPPTDDGELPQDYWTASQYLFLPDSLKSGAGPTAENNATLQDDAIWVTGSDGKLIRIPLDENDLKRTSLSKQNCMPSMGTHYYKTKNDQSESDVPWFGLVKEGKVIGCGFQTIGRKPSVKNPDQQTDYFEDGSKGSTFTLLTMPDASERYLQLQETYGLLSLHLYYINEPWKITCEPSDSSDPDSAADTMDKVLAALASA